MLYIWLKIIHIISSTLLFGTGLGSAFYFYQANKTQDLSTKVFAARNVVLADWLFTTPAVIIQPITGIWMASLAGFSLWDWWLNLSIVLYLFTGACWIPVVWLQMQMHRMAKAALEQNKPLPKIYSDYFRIWFWLGWPAFLSVIIIFILMTLKPMKL